MSKRRTRIALVEDDRLLADMLALWLSKQANCELVARAEDGERGRELCLATKPDLVLLDIEMPKLDGLELAQRLVVELPQARLLAMSGLMDPYTVWRVMQAGVHGYVDKTQSVELLMQAIGEVIEGRKFFSPVFQNVKTEWLSQPEAFQKILSDREQEVLKWVVAGRDDEYVGSKLGITTATVAAHRKHIRQKLDLHSDRDLVAYARRWGLSPGGRAR